jgi:hypothetical protein
MPWIHIADAAQLIADAVLDPTYRGPLNVVAPNPARAEIVARSAKSWAAAATAAAPAPPARPPRRGGHPPRSWRADTATTSTRAGACDT